MKRQDYLAWMSTAGILMTLLVISGAFGAHGLKTRISTDSMATYETAIRYGIIHSLGLLIVNLIGMQLQVKTLWTNLFFLLGMALFTLALMVHASRDALGLDLSLAMLAPIGGLSYITGWILFTLSLRRS